MRVVERVGGHYYVVEDVEDFGKVYRWRPESIVMECEECDKRTTLTRSELTRSKVCCECGVVPREEEVVLEVLDEDYESEQAGRRPWRQWHTSERTGLPI